MRGGTQWGLILLVTVLVVLHFVLRVGLGLGVLAPDLLVVALLIAAREMRAGLAAGLGLLLGVLDGAVLPAMMGSSALVLTILGFLGARTRHLVASDSLSFIAVYVFFGKWLFDALLALVAWVFSPHIRPDLGALLLISPLAALYAALAGLVALALYRVLS